MESCLLDPAKNEVQSLWQYRRGKELAEKTQHIQELLGRCNSNIVAGRANVSDIRHLSPQDYIHFESRELKFQDLLEALQDDNSNTIGLQGIGGAGKTSMAKEVGYKLKESKSIDKFIFLIVSKPPDFKKICGELAKGLDLSLEEVKEEELSSTIFSKITKMDKKLLIILDDVWEKFDLIENLGIPSGHKGCNLLITTRSSQVCIEMGCRVIELCMLNNKEALNLFEAHAKLNNSSRGLKGMPEKIVEHCGGIPVAIVGVARALKNQPATVWKDALKTLEDHVVDQELKEAYNCFKLSYDNLKNEKAKELFLICSLFPEDYQVPIQVLTKIGTGLSSSGENDIYHLARTEVHGAIMELIDCSLLLHGEDEYVKMHDLVREVALRIGVKDIQSFIDLKMPIKENLRYLLFWNNNDFPTKFDGNKLEVLVIFFNGLKTLNVLDTLSKEMMRLKVLVLRNNFCIRTSALLLINSLQPLKDIRTLILRDLDLGDISALGNLLSLNTLWFMNCSIIELPREFWELKKLRSLEVEGCKIKKNNPFEVIERCTQLEELTFVGNECENEEKDAISHKESPLTLHRYRISSKDFSNHFEKYYGSMSRCIQIDDQLSHLVSEATFKQLVRRAELLILEGEDAQRICKNLILDIVAIDKGGMMNDLIVLDLSSCPTMECLIDTNDHDYFGVAAFCNLVGLQLSKVGVEDLFRGPPPSGFLEQLEIMKLKECHRLKSLFSNGNYNLCHLKSMELEDCPMLASVFQPSTAQSLMKLEKLTIRDCSALECIIVREDGDSNQKSYQEALFPKLKILQIERCSKLRIILPILFAGGLASLETLSICWCWRLEYIFDKFQEGEDAMLPSLKELELSGAPSFIGMCKEYHQLMGSSMQKPSPPHSRHNSNNTNQSPARRAFSWVQACCSLNKSRPASEDAKITVSEQKPHDHTIPLELDPSVCGVFPSHVAQSLLVQSLKNAREIELWECGNLISLSTLSIAASTIALESLTISECHKLKCITTHEGDAQVDNNNYCSIFPTLENLEIEDCRELEFLFQSAISGGLQKLKSLTTAEVPKLIYVVGNQNSSAQNQNNELHFDLPALEILSIDDAPKMNSVCSKNYKLALSSLKNVRMWNCGIKSFTDNDMVDWTTTELCACVSGSVIGRDFVASLMGHSGSMG
ncbi:disease resistance protein SUMM2-like [Neltuma alba]|uniref:disease resistance protein SUMM2-like n=1 Tax=Neltuma alba TaxID=207710 RepID=UPI0010A3D11C|nr:disease resistance protein SUMM2-like [Prosopis alba]